MNYLDFPALYRKLLPFLLILLFFPAGCKKDTPVEAGSQRFRLITGTSWLITKALDVGSNPGSPVDITLQMPMGYLTFSANGTFSSAGVTGTWEFAEGETKLILNSSTLGGTVSVNILELTETLLRLKMQVAMGDQPRLLEVTLASFKPDISPIVNFETMWKEFDTRYSFFEYKKINWDSVYSYYRPQVKSTTTDAGLFQIMSSMMATLKDGHVNLYSPVGTFAYSDWYTKYPANFISEENITKYLSKDYGKLAGGYLRYGKINDDIGYIYIGHNLLGSDGDWTLAIDRIIDSLKNTKGIVIDIRNNGGGSENLGQIVASRFYDRQRTYCYTSWRMGPSHSNLTKPEAITISPGGRQQYLKPVALLTNRHCFSSAEGTILMLRVLPNVVTIGDYTGGGSGNPISLILPNGWSYRLSRWIQYTADMEIFEGKGLAPKIQVGISEADLSAGKDAILEYAVSYLRNK